jgi:hypothetical protein
MNYIISFFRCVPEFPEPDHIQTLPRWVFKYGSVVHAYTFVSALRKLERVQLNRYWASEIEANLWDVQFDDDVFVENIHASNAHDAFELARLRIIEDSHDPRLVSTTARVTDGRERIRE